MATRFTDLANMGNVIADILGGYKDGVLSAIADGADDAAENFMDHAEKVSPEDTGEYKKSWAVKPMKKAKYVRYVGNTKKVKAHRTDAKPTIPLINILEYSKRHPLTKHVQKAIDNSKDEIVDIFASKINKAGGR